MSFLKKILSVFLLSLIISGCAAMLVPETDDPAKKLSYAYMLFDEQQRPLPAERLIRESIDIYKKENNELGLAEAYRAYGFFFRSRSVKKWQKKYEEIGFYEPEATYKNRYEKSIEYFEKAKDIYQRKNKYDRLTNIYLNMGFTYEFSSKKSEACDAYKKSLSNNIKHIRKNPDAPMILPEGFKTYEEYISGFNKRLGCK